MNFSKGVFSELKTPVSHPRGNQYMNLRRKKVEKLARKKVGDASFTFQFDQIHQRVRMLFA